MEGWKDLYMADTDTCRLGDWRHSSSLFSVLLCCPSIITSNIIKLAEGCRHHSGRLPAAWRAVEGELNTSSAYGRNLQYFGPGCINKLRDKRKKGEKKKEGRKKKKEERRKKK